MTVCVWNYYLKHFSCEGIRFLSPDPHPVSVWFLCCPSYFSLSLSVPSLTLSPSLSLYIMRLLCASIIKTQVYRQRDGVIEGWTGN